jgi:hypothetical protein
MSVVYNRQSSITQHTLNTQHTQRTAQQLLIVYRVTNHTVLLFVSSDGELGHIDVPLVVIVCGPRRGGGEIIR